MKHQKNKLVAPDGGWGWIVCLGTSLMTLALRSLDPSFGLLFGDLLKELKVDTTGASIIMSCLETVMSLSGMLTGVLIKKYGYRKVAFLGCFLSYLGLMISSQANSMAYIICTYSIIGGLGAGFGITAAFVSINCYFREKRTQAVGFSMAGTSLGMMCMPLVVHLLLSHYDFRGTVLIISAINFHSMIGCCLLQPVELHLKKVPYNKELDSDENGTSAEKRELLKAKEEMEEIKLRKISIRSSVSNLSAVDLAVNYRKDDEESDENKISKKSFSKRMIALFDLNLLKDPSYLNIIIGLSLFMGAEANFKLITPFFLSSIGLTKAEIAFSLSLTAFADVLARLTFPTIVNRMKVSNRKVFWYGSMCVAVARSTIAQLMPGKVLFGLLFLNGLFRGIVMTNVNLCVAEQCTLQVLPSALGLFNVCRGLMVVISGPLLGYIRDASESFQVSIHTMSAIMFVCFTSWGIEFGFKKYRGVEKNLKKENDVVNAA